MEYDIRQLTLDDIADISSLLTVCFGIKTSKKSDLIEWKFFTPSGALVAYGAFVDKELVSFYSNKKVTVTTNSKSYSSSICVDMATHPDHRRKGLISILSKHVYGQLLKEGLEFAIGFSNSKGVLVDKHSCSYGYQIVGRFKTYRILLFHRKRIMESLAIKKVSNIFRIPNNSLPLLQLTNSREHLTWRYKQHERAREYELMEVMKAEKSIGCAIIQVKGAGVGILKIVTSDMRNVADIIQALSSYYALQKKRYLTITVLPNSHWNDVFKKNKLWIFTKEEDYYFTVKALNYQNKDIFNSENWFLTGGDII